MEEQAQGVAIDEADIPAWARSRFSAAQLQLNKGLLWVLLAYMSEALEASRINVAQRLYVHTAGREKKKANPSHESLARDCSLAMQTVVDSVDDLEAQGWILVDRLNNHFNVYRLAWPVADVLQPADPPELCGQPTKKGPCGRRAGWGTDHRGVGPCKLHPLELQPLESNNVRNEASQLQPLESGPVDNSDAESPSTPTIGIFNSNHWSVELQPLEPSTPTVGGEYVGSALQSSLLSTSTPVLSEGQLTVRTARETDTAPPAQPEVPFIARSLIAAIPRYRTADGWVKKQLAARAATALAAGFSRDAITRYAHMVIGEARYLDRQHIPEFREVLRRLARDAAQDNLCRACASPACSCPTPAAPDRPWTVEDAAELERALDYLGATPDDLDTTGTP